MKRTMEMVVKRIFSALGYQVQLAPLRLWDADAAFAVLARESDGYTIMDRTRCFMLYQFARQARALPGDAVEVGVYKGGTARVISKVLFGTPKIVHLFDTFAGMPETDTVRDTVRADDFSNTSLDGVRRYLRDCPNVRFHPGVFPATAAPAAGLRFCLAHIDVDIFASVRDCCAFFYPRMVAGGMKVFDDYGHPDCPGVKPAVDSFFADKKECPWYLPTGQCVAVRLQGSPGGPPSAPAAPRSSTHTGA